MRPVGAAAELERRRRHAVGLPERGESPTADAHGGDVAASLRRLRWSPPGPIAVPWGRNQIHSRPKAVRAHPAKHPGVVAEDFPGYAPGPNPDERVWGRTKYGRPADLAADDAQQPWDDAVGEPIDLKFRPDLSESFVRSSGPPSAA